MYRRIMIVVDQRPVAQAAVTEGLALARTQDATVIFFTAMPLYPMPLADVPPFVVVPPKEYQQAADEEADKLLCAAAARAVKSGVRARVVKGAGEDPAQSIVEAARRRRCELIVVASQGRNALLRLLTGSVIPALITASPIPVLICKQVVRPAGRSGHVAPARKTLPRKRRTGTAAR